MIVDMVDTSSGQVADRLVRLRSEGGSVALGRVLTLVVDALPEHVEDAIRAADDASREHPCRIVVVADARPDQRTGLDAQIRVGGNAGVSEVVVLRPSAAVRRELDTLVIPLLLPDAPVVAWWTAAPPDRPSADPIGAMASRRITDAARCAAPLEVLERLARQYEPGDTDLGWARCTPWRALLASALDSTPFEEVTAVEVIGDLRSPTPVLLAAWLGQRLGCRAVVRSTSTGDDDGVRLTRRSGTVSLMRPEGSSIATLDQPDRPPQRIVLARRSLAEVLAEDLRRLDPDPTYGVTVTRGLRRVRIR